MNDDYEYPTKTEWSRFWIDLGMGGEIPISKHFFVRPQAIFGFAPGGAPEAYFAGGGKNTGGSSDIKFTLAAGAGWRF